MTTDSQVIDDDLILSGHVTGVHGIKGWLKIFSNTSPREQIADLSPWSLKINGELVKFDIKGKKQGKLILAHIKGCDDRNTALEYVGAEIYIYKSQLPTLESGDYYWSDLVGLQVESIEGDRLGRVDHLLETGANDVLVVQGEHEYLIPFVLDTIVVSIDLDKGVMSVDWQADYL